jgi:very-short-patch-repair endonuclease
VLDMTDTDDDAPFRGVIRLASERRVSHGLGVFRREGLTEDEEFRRDLNAYLLVLPEGARFTHVTAARLLGWQLPKLPDQVPVFAAVSGDPARPRRPGLICSRLVSPCEAGHPVGLPVDRAEEILLRAARDLGLLDVLIMLESALRLGHIDRERMDEVLESKRPGVRMLREAWRRAAGKSESAGETVLQEFHRVMDVPFVPQAEIYDDQGTFLARVDLLIEGTNSVHEYDGEHHRSKNQQRVDLRRDRALGASSYVRRGYTLDDLLNHPAVVMHELDAELGRPHDLGRLRRWKRLVDNSLYAEAGRERVLNRWRRHASIVDWSGSA